MLEGGKQGIMRAGNDARMGDCGGYAMRKKLSVLALAAVLWVCMTGTALAALVEGVDYTITADGGLIITEGVTTIPNFAFRGKTDIVVAEIPASVTAIGNYAFFGCSSLTTVIYHGTAEPAAGRSAFSRTAVAVVDVPADYEGDTFAGILVRKENVPAKVEEVVIRHRDGNAWQNCGDEIGMVGQGAEKQFSAQVLPENAENKNVSWSVDSGNIKHFVVVHNGAVTVDFSQCTDADFDAVEGEYRNDLVVTTEDGGKTDRVTITVPRDTLVLQDEDGTEIWSVGRPAGVAIHYPESVLNPQKDGYTFRGWMDENGTVTQKLPENMPGNGQADNQVIYTASWEAADAGETGNPEQGAMNLPQTGDASMLGAWIALFGASAMGLRACRKK